MDGLLSSDDEIDRIIDDDVSVFDRYVKKEWREEESKGIVSQPLPADKSIPNNSSYHNRKLFLFWCSN